MRSFRRVRSHLKASLVRFWKEVLGKTADTLEELHLPAGLGVSGGSPGERGDWASLLRLLPP